MNLIDSREGDRTVRQGRFLFEIEVGADAVFGGKTCTIPELRGITENPGVVPYF